ncbi:hypothetical protein J7I94_03335 [Streptomyces sp. ISL-12]|uniref:sensor histidine kinase n=1 Tax=Streptomyces sp. ISL-12 TaxID=2819177 RepID=UPI001BE7459C|nr:ATP-binding protein [Streptomyces sp. ISL-12]MBT2409597.1 hypothetical protein [Streptomyces sp. ISL-12]
MTELLRRYVPLFRTVVVCACTLLVVPAMPVGGMAAAGGVSAVAIVWSLLYRFWFRAAPGARTLLVTDLVVMTGLCLSQGLTVPAAQTGHGSTWINVVISFVAVGYQLTHPVPTGAVVAVYLAAADLVGVALAGAAQGQPDTWTEALPHIGLLLLQAAMSRALHVIVHRSSREVDRAVDETAAVQRDLRVAESRRAAERTHLATLHDTACTTMLMVSLPGSPVPVEVVRAQAARDLDRLRNVEEPTGTADLMAELSRELARHPLVVQLRGPGDGREEYGAADGTPLWLWRPAVAALRDSSGEALRNVVRHAGVSEARIAVEQVAEQTVVTIEDRGRGFDVTKVPEHKQGLARSIVDRMRVVGGRAEVRSRPGQGTRVRLEWPRV